MVSPAICKRSAPCSLQNHGKRRVGTTFSHQPVGDAARMVGRVLHRLQTHRVLQRMARRERGAIADRRDIGVGGQQKLVNDDAVLDGEAGGGGELFVRHDADADDDEVGGQTAPILKHDMCDAAAIAAQPLNARAKAELDPSGAVRVGEIGRGVGANDAGHHPIDQLDDVYGLALAAGDRGEFEADEAGADDNAVLGRGETLPQILGLGEGAQIATPSNSMPGSGGTRLRAPVARTRWS